MNSTDVLDLPEVGGNSRRSRPSAKELSSAIDAETYDRTNTVLAPEGEFEPVRDRFRMIALRLDGLLGARASRVVVVTSPSGGDGKTTNTLHVGAALARDLGRVSYLSEGQTRELLDLKAKWGFKDPRNEAEMKDCDIAIYCPDRASDRRAPPTA